MKILLTGFSGFIGLSLLFKLNNHLVITIGRTPASKNVNFFLKKLSTGEKYTVCLKGVNTVIHCAARVHLTKDCVSDPLNEFRAVNTDGTLNLARQAAKAGVKRFVFLSTIKVNGETTTGRAPFSESDSVSPHDPYAVSKTDAEVQLLALATHTGMEVVIIRPPLVYGPEVKGNFFSMIRLIKKNIPLPLGSITQNKRSLVALDNLIDFIILCADYKKTPRAANQIFLISDREDVSTAELFRRVAKAYNKKSRLFPMPVWLLRLLAKISGQMGLADRLLGSLQVDSSKAGDLLDWKPIITMEEQLRKMAEADLNSVDSGHSS